jgi:hypothetical protein
MRMLRPRWRVESVVQNGDGTTYRRTPEKDYWFHRNAIKAMRSHHERLMSIWPPLPVVVMVRRTH